jgi:putative hemolysin
MIWEIILIFALLIANGAFAMAEIAIISSRKVRLQRKAEQGDERARDALLLANSPSEFLSSVQVGLTLVSIVTGALGGATLADRAGEWMQEQMPWLGKHGHAVAFVLVVGSIAYVSLVIGELVPKRIALGNPEGIAVVVAKPMRAVLRLATPVVSLLSWTSDLCLRMIGTRASDEPVVSEEEVRGMIEQGLGAGVFHEREKEMLEGVFQLDQLLVADLMTPSARILWLNVDDVPEVTNRAIVASGHSRFPVYQGNRDNVVGVVEVKALWANMALAGTADLRSVMFPPLVVPESLPAVRLLETFRSSGRHLALVSDEFGMIQGLITLHDVVEAIVGQLPEKGLRLQPTVKRRDDGSLLVDASVEIGEFKRVARIKRLPGEERGEFLSIGGFVIDQLEHIPEAGERIVAAGHVFEVVDMDLHRIDKILVTKV